MRYLEAAEYSDSLDSEEDQLQRSAVCQYCAAGRRTSTMMMIVAIIRLIMMIMMMMNDDDNDDDDSRLINVVNYMYRSV